MSSAEQKLYKYKQLNKKYIDTYIKDSILD